MSSRGCVVHSHSLPPNCFCLISVISGVLSDSDYSDYSYSTGYTNTEINDTLLIRIAPNGYFGEVEYDTVMYGENRTDGTRPSMIYYQNNGMTIMYQFEKTDIAQLDGEAAERLYAMIHSAIYFDSNSAGSGYEGNDELEDIDVPTN